jgi:L-galactose dehydrogenase
MMGLLSGSRLPAWHPAPATMRATCKEAHDYCRNCGPDLEVLALQYVLQDDRIASTLVGMCSVAEVDTNLRALDEPLDPGLLADVLAILQPVHDQEWPSGNWPVGA